MAILPPDASRPVPKPRGGLAHILDAAGYSIAGMTRLVQESAARLELGAGAIAMVAFWLKGATLVQWLILGALFLAVLAVEALNTAVEVLVDRVSPEWSIDAKQAKDLGSLAVGLSLTIAGGFVAAVLLGV